MELRAHHSPKRGCLFFVFMVAILFSLLVGYMFRVASRAGEQHVDGAVGKAPQKPLVVPREEEEDSMPLIIPQSHGESADGNHARKS